MKLVYAKRVPGEKGREAGIKPDTRCLGIAETDDELVELARTASSAVGRTFDGPGSYSEEEVKVVLGYVELKPIAVTTTVTAEGVGDDIPF